MSRTEKEPLERPPGLSDAEWAKVLVRWEHAERWVAWRRVRGTEQFVAAADTYEEIHKVVEAAGIKGVSYEWVPPIPTLWVDDEP
jgi:hypothetical protein